MNITTILTFLLVIGVWYFFLRTRATQLESRQQFDTMIQGGKPIIVDFFSNT